MSKVESNARNLLAMTLDERGFHCEAENVREGEDLESYEGEIQAIAQLLKWGVISGIAGLSGDDE